MLNMSWRHGKSSGWASFKCKQRKKHNLDPKFDNEHFPPMPTPFHPCSKTLMQHNDLQYPAISFSSVAIPLISENYDTIEELGVNTKSSSSEVVRKELKSIHCWAEFSLINDIMEAVDNDFRKASSLLTEMISIDENIAELYPGSENPSFDKSLNNKDASSRGIGIDLKLNSDIFTDDYVCGDSKIVSNDFLKQKNFIPLEPEWEEDDIYFLHRRGARSMARAACHHSKAAANAFARGDHISARAHSLTAREKSMVAEKLNAKAAKEILSIRNCKNDIWRLDLHGLHASEAVVVVQEQLQKIEFDLSSSSCSLEFHSCVDKVRVRQTCLQIITGIGNHSRGEAALPLAVRNFLDQNGYWFNEPRPGVISVRPKFRGL